MVGQPGRRSVVTGSARGIGLAFVEELAALGCVPFGVDVRDLGAPGIQRLVTDLATREGRAEAACAAREREPEVTVACAGIVSYPPFVGGDLESDLRVLGVNLTSALTTIHASLPSIIARRGAAVVLSSMSAYQPNTMLPLYGATKWALAILGRSLHRQLDGRATITVVHPGVARTDIWAEHGAEPASVVPERFWATPAQIAQAALRAAEAGRGMVVPGTAYRMLAPIAQSLPRRVGARMAAAAEGASVPRSRPPGTTERSRSMVVVGDDPGAVRSLIAAGRARRMDVVVVGGGVSRTRTADHVEVDLASPDGRSAAIRACGAADLVVVTAGRRNDTEVIDVSLADIEARFDGAVPGILAVTRGAVASAPTAPSGGRTVILAADESGLFGDAGDPIGAGINALLLRLGTSIGIESNGSACRVASATGGLRSADPAAGLRVMAAIDRGELLAAGDPRWSVGATEWGRALRRARSFARRRPAADPIGSPAATASPATPISDPA